MIEFDNTISDIYIDNDWVEFAYVGEHLIYEKIFTRKLREGVIIFQDTKNNIKKAAKPSKLSKIDLERYVPIGVVVTPLNSERHLMMSLPVMVCEDPTKGSIDKTGSSGNNSKPEMTWGPTVNISAIPNINNEAEVLQSFEGKEYTRLTIERRGERDYSTWLPNDNNATATYPAPSCCDMFFTEGTEQQSWYLPAMGELNYVTQNYDTIEATLTELISYGVFACNLEDDSYWSSNNGTAAGIIGGGAWRMKVYKGTTSREYKASTRYFVRAFHEISLEEFNKAGLPFNPNDYEWDSQTNLLK